MGIDWRFLVEKYVMNRHRHPEWRIIKRMQKIHGDLFVDVGSNQKVYANALRDNFKRIITIDPNPVWNADMKLALSKTAGEQPFYIGNNISADSLIHNPHILGREWENGSQTMTVQTVTFDDLQLNADLVKIDVEGAELDVIAGMNKFLPKRVLIELHDERREDELRLKMWWKSYKPEKLDSYHWLFTFHRMSEDPMQYWRDQDPLIAAVMGLTNAILKILNRLPQTLRRRIEP